MGGKRNPPKIEEKGIQNEATASPMNLGGLSVPMNLGGLFASCHGDDNVQDWQCCHGDALWGTACTKSTMTCLLALHVLLGDTMIKDMHMHLLVDLHVAKKYVDLQ